jgi:hypothetical protein
MNHEWMEWGDFFKCTKCGLVTNNPKTVIVCCNLKFNGDCRDCNLCHED